MSIHLLPILFCPGLLLSKSLLVKFPSFERWKKSPSMLCKLHDSFDPIDLILFTGFPGCKV